MPDVLFDLQSLEPAFHKYCAYFDWVNLDSSFSSQGEFGGTMDERFKVIIKGKL